MISLPDLDGYFLSSLLCVLCCLILLCHGTILCVSVFFCVIVPFIVIYCSVFLLCMYCFVFDCIYCTCTLTPRVNQIAVNKYLSIVIYLFFVSLSYEGLK